MASGKWNRLVYQIVILMLISFSSVQAKDLFEYQWPQESGTDWFIKLSFWCLYLSVAYRLKICLNTLVASGKWNRLVYIIVTLMLLSFSNIQAKDLFEYQWPKESGADWFMLLSFWCLYLSVAYRLKSCLSASGLKKVEQTGLCYCHSGACVFQ